MKPQQTKPREKERTFVILSIQPEHATRIYAGKKKYELRKKVTSVPFSHVFLCENGSGITGCFETGSILREERKTLWKHTGELGTSRKRFLRYFSQHAIGNAIEVLNPVRFKQELSIEELREQYPRFTPPQSSMIVRKDHPLYETLEKRRRMAFKSVRKVELKRILDSQRDDYKSLIQEHVGSHYDEIDKSFAEANLRIHDLGRDPSGFFTEKKEVLTIWSNKTPVGFTTLTYKRGGSVKSGPTILYSEFRKRGYGAATRASIETYARRQGMRKVYCTCPADNFEVMKYLLASGYRVEAHLELHYSSDHSELVFGKVIGPNVGAKALKLPTNDESGRIQKVDHFQLEPLVESIQSMFGSGWVTASKTFVKQLINDAREAETVKYAGKPKFLICVKGQEKCIASAILLPKRGGSLKAFLLRATANKATLRRLINACEQRAIKLQRRKIYFLHPLPDHEIVDLLTSRNYVVEGVLRAPYVEGRDVVVVSKFL
jgi:predicted transcriptional regulator/RimJ/RimL family protein N-acetyltransferase